MHHSLFVRYTRTNHDDNKIYYMWRICDVYVYVCVVVILINVFNCLNAMRIKNISHTHIVLIFIFILIIFIDHKLWIFAWVGSELIFWKLIPINIIYAQYIHISSDRTSNYVHLSHFSRMLLNAWMCILNYPEKKNRLMNILIHADQVL